MSAQAGLAAARAEVQDAMVAAFVGQPMVREALDVSRAALDDGDAESTRAALVLLLSVLTPFES